MAPPFISAVLAASLAWLLTFCSSSSSTAAAAAVAIIATTSVCRTTAATGCYAVLQPPSLLPHPFVLPPRLELVVQSGATSAAGAYLYNAAASVMPLSLPLLLQPFAAQFLILPHFSPRSPPRHVTLRRLRRWRRRLSIGYR